MSICRSAQPLEINDTFRHHHFESDGSVAFSIDVPAAGYLVLTAVSGNGAADPRLTFLGRACSFDQRQETFHYLERSAHALILQIPSAGSYFLSATFEDSLEAGIDYKLATRFIERHAASFDSQRLIFAASRGSDSLNDGGSDEWDNEILPAPRPSPQPVVTPNDGGSDEWDNEILPTPTPSPQPVVTPNDGGSDEWDNEILPAPRPSPRPIVNPNGAEKNSSSWCDAYGRDDDHSDVALCASILSPARRLSGELGNDWQDDSDTFTFELREARRVHLETLGTTNTLGRLFDRFGLQLAQADDGGDGENFAIDIYLGPGRYFLRVEGAGFAEGSYGVSLTLKPDFSE